MGQKVNPIGLRLGIIKGWDSNWYGGRDFADKLYEDQNIRKYVFARIPKGGISKVIIERTLKRITLTIQTARPGVVIGKGGSEVDKLKEELKLGNVMEVPRVTKITLNMGLGEAIGDKKVIEHAVADLEKITGQKVVVTYARKSIAGFKVREGWPIGVKVTLRRERMYEFLDRLLSISLPRVRDFRGLSGKSFDGRGNYAMGLKEHIVFPEINFDKVDEVWGMDIIICTNAETDAEAKALLKHFNMPFNS